MDERLAHIRANEKMSHVAIYTNEKLYQSNTWLRKPIKQYRIYALYLTDTISFKYWTWGVVLVVTVFTLRKNIKT